MVAGIILVALSLRGPIIAPTPVITNIQADIGLSSVAAGLLTGLPVFLFAVVTAAYSAALSVGSMITAPSSRRTAEAPAEMLPPAEPDTAHATGRVRRIGWLLALAFCGQAMAYYSVTAWLPALLADTRGLSLASSGASASLFQVAAVIGAFGMPLLAARAPAWVPVALIGALWITLPIGLMLAPGWFIAWSLIGGAAQGGGFTAIFSIVARVARSSAEAARMSARVQGIGYLAATIGPPLAGGLNTATGTWTAPLLLVLAATVVFTVGGVLAAFRARS